MAKWQTNLVINSKRGVQKKQSACGDCLIRAIIKVIQISNNTTTFTLLRIFSPLEMVSITIWETIQSWHAKCSLPVAIHVFKNPSVSSLTSIVTIESQYILVYQEIVSFRSRRQSCSLQSQIFHRCPSKCLFIQKFTVPRENLSSQ